MIKSLTTHSCIFFLFYFLAIVAVVLFSLFQVVEYQLVISYELAILLLQELNYAHGSLWPLTHIKLS